VTSPTKPADVVTAPPHFSPPTRLRFAKRAFPWQLASPSTASATSAFLPTSTRARRRSPSASSFTRVEFIKSMRCAAKTGSAPRWTRWIWNARRASPFNPQRPTACGTAPRSSSSLTTSTSSTRRATWTSPSRWSARSACSTARFSSSIREKGCKASRLRSTSR